MNRVIIFTCLLLISVNITLADYNEDNDEITTEKNEYEVPAFEKLKNLNQLVEQMLFEAKARRYLESRRQTHKENEDVITKNRLRRSVEEDDNELRLDQSSNVMELIENLRRIRREIRMLKERLEENRSKSKE